VDHPAVVTWFTSLTSWPPPGSQDMRKSGGAVSERRGRLGLAYESVNIDPCDPAALERRRRQRPSIEVDRGTGRPGSHQGISQGDAWPEGATVGGSQRNVGGRHEHVIATRNKDLAHLPHSWRHRPSHGPPSSRCGRVALELPGLVPRQRSRPRLAQGREWVCALPGPLADLGFRCGQDPMWKQRAVTM